MIVKTVVVDESGHTGADLLNSDQRCFSMASVCVTEEDARSILSVLPATKSAEYKAARMLASHRGQTALIQLLQDPRVNKDSCKVYLIDKAFMATTTLVDTIHVEIARLGDIELHQRGAAASLAHLLHLCSPTYSGKDAFFRMLSSFVAFNRDATQAKLGVFLMEFLEFYTACFRKDEQFAVEFWFPVIRYRDMLLDFSTRGIPYDPVITALLPMIHYWGATLGAFNLVCDESKSLSRIRSYVQQWSDPSIPPKEVGFGMRKATYPLKVKSFEFEKSEQRASIQLADLIAGLTRRAMEETLGFRVKTDISEQVMTLIYAKKLILDGLVPSKEAISEMSVLEDPFGVNIADYTASLLKGAPKL